MLLRELSFGGVCLRLLFALVLGGALGLEREVRNRGAGLRTHILVCMGACLVMMTNLYVYQSYGTGDPVRMGAQVISGIGFLGAGTIITASSVRIRGLTTAAGLWLAGCIGLACGVGFYYAAAVCSVITLLSLQIFHRLEAKIQAGVGRVEVYVELEPGKSLGDFITLAHENGIRVTSFQVEAGCAQDRVAFRASLRWNERKKTTEGLTDRLTASPMITCMEICS